MTDVFSDSCVLHWREPEDDGGAPVTHYVVEVMDLETKGSWIEAGEVTSDQTDFKVKNLKEKHKYKFRVKAINKVGASEPALCPDTILAKDPWGEKATFTD